MKFHKNKPDEKKHREAENLPEEIPENAGNDVDREEAEGAEPDAAVSATTVDEAPAAGPERRLAELEEQNLRLRAEYANYKRRAEKERNDLSNYIKASVYREIIPTLDDFERFFLHVEDRKDGLASDFVQGIEMIHKSLVAVLQRQGIETIQAEGVPFDPNLHEAMFTEKVEDEAADHTVLQVLEAGYRMGEVVIRPARVKVGVREQS